jgi:hypothetical protein
MIVLFLATVAILDEGQGCKTQVSMCTTKDHTNPIWFIVKKKNFM